jgi:hypothetical protein
MDDPMRLALLKAMEWQRTHPQELYAELIRMGIINEKGEVIVRKPVHPDEQEDDLRLPRQGNGSVNGTAHSTPIAGSNS